MTGTKDRRVLDRLVRPGFILLMAMALLATVVVAGPAPAAAQGSSTRVGNAECSGGSGAVFVTVTNNNDDSMPIWVRLRQGGVDLPDPHILFDVQANSTGGQELTGIPNGSYDVQVIWGSPYLPNSVFLASEPRTISCSTYLATPTWRAPSVAANSTKTQINATWNPVANRSSYHVQWSDDNIPIPVSTGITGTTDTLTVGNRTGRICAQVRAIGTGNNLSSNYNTPQCTTITATTTLATPTWRAPSVAANSTKTQINATWNPVANRSSYHVQWSDDNIPIPVSTGITGTTDTLTVGNRTGRICAQVRAIGTGNNLSSNYNTPQCTTIPRALAPPNVDTPTVSGNTATVTWDPVTNHSSYEVRWSLNDVSQPARERPKDATHNTMAFVANSTGDLCAEVRAIGTGNYTNSPWQIERCVQLEAHTKLDPPRWRTSGVVVSYRRLSVNAYWYANPKADRYEVTWFHDGNEIDPSASTTGTWAYLELDGLTGEFCAEVKAIGSGNNLTSDPSEQKCDEAVPVFSLPRWDSTPIVPSDTGGSLTASWSRPATPTNFRPERYNTQWTLDGSFIGFTSSGLTSSTMLLGDRSGEFCAKVRADGTGSIRTSPYTGRECVTVLAPPEVTLAASNESASWELVDGAEGYTARWTYDDRLFDFDQLPRTATSSTTQLGPRLGNICVQVKSEGAGEVLDSPYSPKQCRMVNFTLPAPSWDDGVTLDTAAGTVTASWRSVSRAQDYAVEWTLGPETWTTEVDGLSTEESVTGRVGSLCATVRATSSLPTIIDSPPNESLCVVLGAPMETPAWTSLSYDGSADRVNAAWGSVDPQATYDIRWFEDRESQPFTETSSASETTQLNLAGRAGRICAEVRTAALQGRAASPYSAQRCTYVRPKTPEWAAEALTVSPNFDAPETVTATWLPIDDPDSYYVIWTVNGDREGKYVAGTSTSLTLGDRRGTVCTRVYGRDGGVWSSPTEERCIEVVEAEDRQLEAPRATAAVAESGEIVVQFDHVDNASGYELRAYYGGGGDSIHDETSSAGSTATELRITIDQAKNQGRTCVAIVAIGEGTWEDSDPGFRVCADTTDYYTTLGIDDGHDRMTIAEIEAVITAFESTTGVGSIVKPGVASRLTLEQIYSEDIGELLINNPTGQQQDKIDIVALSIGTERLSAFLANAHTSLRVRNPSYATYIELMTPLAFLGGSASLIDYSEQHFIATGQKITGLAGVGLQISGAEYPIGSFNGAKILSGLGMAIGVGSLIQEFAVGGLGDSAQDGFEIGAVVFGVLAGPTPLGLFFGGIAVISGLISVFLPDRSLPPESTDSLRAVLDYLGEAPLVAPPLDRDRLSASLNTTFDRMKVRTDTCGSTGCPDADSSEPSDQGVPNRPATRHVFRETDSYSGWTFAVAVTVFPGGVGDPPAFLQITNACNGVSLSQFPMIREVLGMMRCS